MARSTEGRFSVVMEAGTLRHRVTIERLVESPDGFGGAGAATAWETFASVWAAIEPGGAKEYVAAQQLAADQTTTIRVRYEAAKGVTPKMRVLYQDPDRGPRYFDIQGVIDIDERRSHLQLVCIERNVG